MNNFNIPIYIYDLKINNLKIKRKVIREREISKMIQNKRFF